MVQAGEGDPDDVGDPEPLPDSGSKQNLQGTQPADRAADGERSFTIRGSRHLAPAADPGLYLVATPIGNLSDITIRALEIIAGATRLACEDTRVTATLLSRFSIRRRAFAYHEHNAHEAGQTLLAALEAGDSVALVSDAGTPLVSDPGFRLVEAAIERGIPVVPIPGASAPLAALLASGLPSDAFFFAGFPPQKQGARRARFEALSGVPGTLLFFEAPHRIVDSLADMEAVFGPERQAAVCRELTKTFETIYRGRLDTIWREFAAMDRVRGEIVVCVAPPPERAAAAPEDADAILIGLMAEMKPVEAAKEAARLTGFSRRDLYQRALALKEKG